MEIKVILGAIAVVIALVSYIPYFKDIHQGKTKPHAFSWLIWGILTAIAFAVQLIDGGGAGAWVTGFTAIVAFSIFFISLKKGEKNITLSDWASLLGAGLALVLWFVTKEPLISIILVTLIHSLGFFPTFRKSISKPCEETLITYLLSAVKFTVGFFALEVYTLTTWLYPVALIFMNTSFVILLLSRRKKL